MPYTSAGEPMACVPKVARETILRGTRRTLKIKQYFFLNILYFTHRSLGIGQYVILRFQHLQLFLVI